MSAVRGAHAHRPLVVRRALLRQVVVLDHLADVVGHVRAQVIAPVGELAHRQVVLADIVEDQRLNVVDVLHAQPVELAFDDFEELAVQPLNQVNGIEILVEHGLSHTSLRYVAGACRAWPRRPL